MEGSRVRAGGSRRRRCRRRRARATRRHPDRRLVEPETLNEERRLRADTTAVGARRDDADAAALRIRRCARDRERPGLAARHGAEVGQGLGAKCDQQRRHLGRIGDVDCGDQEERVAGAARVQLHRQDRRADAHAALLLDRPARKHRDSAAAFGTGLAPIEYRRAGEQGRAEGDRRSGAPDAPAPLAGLLHAPIIRARRQSTP
jgi:hypothetical protein